MVTGEAFITDEGRGRILEKYSPLSVDMETASIAHVCYVNGIPFLSIRCITDTAEHSGNETFHANCARASEIAAALVTEIIKEIRKLYESDVPIFAICLGHQLMALATGADTFKLK